MSAGSKSPEFRTSGDTELNVGDVLTVDRFEAGQKIDVVGTSKGRPKVWSSAMVLLGVRLTVQCSTAAGVHGMCQWRAM